MIHSTHTLLRFVTGFFSLSCVLLLSACSLAKSPEQNADAFWQAIASGDFDTAKGLTVSNSLGQLPGEQNFQNLQTQVQAPKALTEDTQTLKLITEQTVTTKDGLNFSYQFHTHMKKRDDTWQVDLASTKPELAAAAIKAAFSQFTGTIGSSADNLSQALGQGLESELQVIGQALNQALNQGLNEAGGELAKMASELERVAKEQQRKLETQTPQTTPAPSAKTSATTSKSNANILANIGGLAQTLTHANIDQSLNLFSDNSKTRLKVFFFNNELKESLPKNLVFTGSEDNAPHLHLNWHDPTTNKSQQKILLNNYQLSLSTNGTGQTNLSLVIPEINGQFVGQFNLN